MGQPFTLVAEGSDKRVKALSEVGLLSAGYIWFMDAKMDRTQIERWVATWREAEPALAEQKRAELERLSTPGALAELAAAFEHAMRTAPVSQTSGLIEQQRYFQQLAR